ncbi:MAG TPA: lysine 5,6-aminomutase subunit alpha, partial [Longimicrobium sp.]|nr:lysine 5,6-aminomutase subunit alpha [Longimicrobium sp.]
MSGPFIEDSQIERARAVAQEVTAPVIDLIGRHTTVSIERTVLRLFGLHDAGARGIPLVNLMVDRLHEAKVLDRGAAYWYGRALQMGARSPTEAVERITSIDPSKLPPLSAEMERNLRDEIRAEARAAVDELRGRIAQRDALRDELKMPPAPHKYVIVATGNIYDDVDQARAAAQAGADVIAVIRSTAQSLL